jgi:competence protein ComEC
MIDKFLPTQEAALLKPLIIGDKSSLDNETKEVFTAAGLTHILVVSGLNIAFVGALVLVCFKVLCLPIRMSFFCAIPFIFLYVLATGANPPVLRAGIMFSCILICLSLDREPLIFNSIALSALLILLFAPQQLFGASFQMSYIATISIICFYPKFHKALGGKRENFALNGLVGAAAVTCAAQVLILPICAYYFGRISLISLLANIAVVPLIGFITILGFVFYFAALVSDFLAGIVGWVLAFLLAAIIKITYFFGRLEYASIAIAKPALWQVFAYFAIAFCFILFKGKKALIAGAGLALICFVSMQAVGIFANGDYERIYENKNMQFKHIKTGSKHYFTITQKGKRFDKAAMKSFDEFLEFSGIKNPEIKFADERGGAGDYLGQEEFKAG